MLVAPPGARQGRATLLLARASTPEQETFIGNQAGGRVFLFLATDDFDRDFEAMRAKGVRFVREPKAAPYGKVAVFEDLYGNLWDLVRVRSSRMMPDVALVTPSLSASALRPHAPLPPGEPRR